MENCHPSHWLMFRLCVGCFDWQRPMNWLSLENSAHSSAGSHRALLPLSHGVGVRGFISGLSHGQILCSFPARPWAARLSCRANQPSVRSSRKGSGANLGGRIMGIDEVGWTTTRAMTAAHSSRIGNEIMVSPQFLVPGATIIFQ